MANHPRSSTPTPAAIPTVVPPLPYLVLALIPIPMMGFVFAGMGGLPTVPPALATPAPAAAAASDVGPAAAPASDAGPAAAPRTPAGAGLPALLVAMLRTEGPFLANEIYSVPPTEPLQPIEEAVAAPEWYAITRGRFVGVVDQFALSAMAISGVAHAARKAYTTQALALTAFNQALTWGGVQVA